MDVRAAPCNKPRLVWYGDVQTWFVRWPSAHVYDTVSPLDHLHILIFLRHLRERNPPVRTFIPTKEHLS